MTDILKLAGQAQQTTEPLGFQIRRAIAAEDELRATKQTLEHAYAALQKVADAQAAIEEPGLLWREIADCVIAALGDRAGILSLDVDAEIEEEIRQEVADTIQAGVRAGMAQQSQDAKRLQRIAHLIGSIFVHGEFKAETANERELEKLLRENGTFWESLEAYDAAMQGGQK